MNSGGPCEVPLVELLERTPSDARLSYEHSPTSHSMIPVGLHAQRAAAKIREMESKLARKQTNFEEYRSISDEMIAERDAKITALESKLSSCEKELAATKGGAVTCEEHSWVGDDDCAYCRADSYYAENLCLRDEVATKTSKLYKLESSGHHPCDKHRSTFTSECAACLVQLYDQQRLELAELATHADHLNTRIVLLDGKLDGCSEYLKEGETPAECIARNRADASMMVGELAKERTKLEQCRAKLDKVMAHPSVSLSTYEAVETERDAALLRLQDCELALRVWDDSLTSEYWERHPERVVEIHGKISDG